ncbi:hypothetical protein [Saccharopolyspora gregorii]|uniref:MFS transporter n=1 Tax=Saccharopolyspora gregorii TaxID=33914 RepID=A0ABP6RKC5_9PSEU
MPLTAATYLASHLLSLLGNGIAAVALPLIVLQTTGARWAPRSSPGRPRSPPWWSACSAGS